ncbi:MAG: hypothetical protein HYU47_10815 [Deltaproteobacteria bacterium]|nr:hypothetical protein [Deltaproteobacteria bacterium]
MRWFYIFLMASLLTLSAPGGWAQAGSSKLDELIAGAKKEGVIEFYGPSTLGPQGAQALAAAFNKKYGLNVKGHRQGRGAFGVGTAAGVGHHGRHGCPSWLAVAEKAAHTF